MEPNGKNMKMFKYSIHEYMNRMPEENFATFPSHVVANKAIADLRRRIPGTVTSPIEVSPLEFFKARQSEYWKGYEAQMDRAAEDCTKDWVSEYNLYLFVSSKYGDEGLDAAHTLLDALQRYFQQKAE